MFLKGCSCEWDRDSKLAVTWGSGGGGVVAKSCPTLATPWPAVYQAPLPGESPGKNTGVGCHFLLQGIFPTQELNLGHLHCRQILYRLNYGGSPSSDLNKIKVYFSIRYNSSWYNNSALCQQQGPKLSVLLLFSSSSSALICIFPRVLATKKHSFPLFTPGKKQHNCTQ